jgi:formylglycine-generating enzyme required for sulfatase activity
MELVLIPPGQFTMGSPASEKVRNDNEYQVDVTISKAFYLGKTEVTQGEWRAVMGTTPWKGKEYVREGDHYAATYVNWEDAKAFCQKLGAKENVVYRLPTEAEWEYACRAGTTTRYSFGDDDSSLSDYAWWGGFVRHGNAKDEQYAHEVGRKQANPFGLYDMHGNVWEWCADGYEEFAKSPGGTDPLVSSGYSTHVFRGGSWCDALRVCRNTGCRSAIRDGYDMTPRTYDRGFRVARSFDQ